MKKNNFLIALIFSYFSFQDCFVFAQPNQNQNNETKKKIVSVKKENNELFYIQRNYRTYAFLTIPIFIGLFVTYEYAGFVPGFLQKGVPKKINNFSSKNFLLSLVWNVCLFFILKQQDLTQRSYIYFGQEKEKYLKQKFMTLTFYLPIFFFSCSLFSSLFDTNLKFYGFFTRLLKNIVVLLGWWSYLLLDSYDFKEFFLMIFAIFYRSPFLFLLALESLTRKPIDRQDTQETKTQTELADEKKTLEDFIQTPNLFTINSLEKRASNRTEPSKKIFQEEDFKNLKRYCYKKTIFETIKKNDPLDKYDEIDTIFKATGQEKIFDQTKDDVFKQSVIFYNFVKEKDATLKDVVELLTTDYDAAIKSIEKLQNQTYDSLKSVENLKTKIKEQNNYVEELQYSKILEEDTKRVETLKILKEDTKRVETLKILEEDTKRVETLKNFIEKIQRNKDDCLKEEQKNITNLIARLEREIQRTHEEKEKENPKKKEKNWEDAHEKPLFDHKEIIKLIAHDSLKNFIEKYSKIIEAFSEKKKEFLKSFNQDGIFQLELFHLHHPITFLYTCFFVKGLFFLLIIPQLIFYLFKEKSLVNYIELKFFKNIHSLFHTLTPVFQWALTNNIVNIVFLKTIVLQYYSIKTNLYNKNFINNLTFFLYYKTIESFLYSIVSFAIQDPIKKYYDTLFSIKNQIKPLIFSERNKETVEKPLSFFAYIICDNIKQKKDNEHKEYRKEHYCLKSCLNDEKFNQLFDFIKDHVAEGIRLKTTYTALYYPFTGDKDTLEGITKIFADPDNKKTKITTILGEINNEDVQKWLKRIMNNPNIDSEIDQIKKEPSTLRQNVKYTIAIQNAQTLLENLLNNEEPNQTSCQGNKDFIEEYKKKISSY